MEREGSKKRETRKRILEVGAAYFMEKGFKDTLIVDIAKEAGLDRRTIYRYFPSKENLLIHLTSIRFAEFAEKFEKHTFESSMNGYDKIKSIFAVYFDFIKATPDMIIFLGMIDTSVGTDMYQRDDYSVLDQYGKRLDKVLELLIDEGQKDGSVNKRFPPMEYAVTINNSLIALATRIAIYLPNVLKAAEGYTWTLLVNQGNILIDSMEAK